MGSRVYVEGMRGAEVAANETEMQFKPAEHVRMAFRPEHPVWGHQPDGCATPDGVLDCSVGVMAYNEQANIADALASILGQKLTSGRIAEIIVVASGCEDQTVPIVEEIVRRDPRVRLIEQERREGKASAVNLFIGAARSPVLALVGADVVVEDGTFDVLLRHFGDPAVGMVGGHPTPVNGETTFLGHAVHLQWRLHHLIACQTPKLGEIVALRNVVPSIPLDSAVDEISIQAVISQLGYRLVYEPEAVVYNRGPATVHDFVRQRRRIYAGHLRVREQQNYTAPTMNVWRIVRALRGSGAFATPRLALWSIGTIALEAAARALGGYDVMRRRQAHVWEISRSTKDHIADRVTVRGQHNVAVFHIVNFQRRQLEIGRHASRRLTQQVAELITQALGPTAIIALQQSGTIIALLSGDREEAEKTAAELVQRFETAPLPLPGHGAPAQVALACGVIAFPQGGPPHARSIPTPVPQPGPATPLVG